MEFEPAISAAFIPMKFILYETVCQKHVKPFSILFQLIYECK